nr:basic proline-rich protein-like [Odocoileus virginianus texanus]
MQTVPCSPQAAGTAPPPSLRDPGSSRSERTRPRGGGAVRSDRESHRFALRLANRAGAGRSAPTPAPRPAAPAAQALRCPARPAGAALHRLGARSSAAAAPGPGAPAVSAPRTPPVSQPPARAIPARPPPVSRPGPRPAIPARSPRLYPNRPHRPSQPGTSTGNPSSPPTPAIPAHPSPLPPIPAHTATMPGPPAWPAPPTSWPRPAAPPPGPPTGFSAGGCGRGVRPRVGKGAGRRPSREVDSPPPERLGIPSPGEGAFLSPENRSPPFRWPTCGGPGCGHHLLGPGMAAGGRAGVQVGGRPPAPRPPRLQHLPAPRPGQPPTSPGRSLARYGAAPIPSYVFPAHPGAHTWRLQGNPRWGLELGLLWKLASTPGCGTLAVTDTGLSPGGGDPGTALPLVQDGPVTICVSQAAAKPGCKHGAAEGDRRLSRCQGHTARFPASAWLPPGCGERPCSPASMYCLPAHPCSGTVCSSLDPRGLKPAQNTLLLKASRGCPASQHPHPGVAAHLLAPGTGHTRALGNSASWVRPALPTQLASRSCLLPLPPRLTPPTPLCPDPTWNQSPAWGYFPSSHSRSSERAGKGALDGSLEPTVPQGWAWTRRGSLSAPSARVCPAPGTLSWDPGPPHLAPDTHGAALLAPQPRLGPPPSRWTVKTRRPPTGHPPPVAEEGGHPSTPSP